MERTFTVHESGSEGFDEAVLQAYSWVMETGGTILFVNKNNERNAREAISKQSSCVPSDSIDGRHKISYAVTYGDAFDLTGPRIAAVSIDDLGMERIEKYITDCDVSCAAEELRAYPNKPNLPRKWIEQFQPELLDWFMQSPPSD